MISALAGKYRVLVEGLADRYYVKSIRYGRLDVSEGAFFPLTPGATLDIEISANVASLTATVRDSEGDPVPQAFVIAERDRKAADGASVRIPCAADQDGVVRMTGLPPASYRLYAFGAGDLSSARGLDLIPYAGRATTVELAGGGQSRVDLRIAAPQP